MFKRWQEKLNLLLYQLKICSKLLMLIEVLCLQIMRFLGCMCRLVEMSGFCVQFRMLLVVLDLSKVFIVFVEMGDFVWIVRLMVLMLVVGIWIVWVLIWFFRWGSMWVISFWVLVVVGIIESVVVLLCLRLVWGLLMVGCELV